MRATNAPARSAPWTVITEDTTFDEFVDLSSHSIIDDLRKVLTRLSQAGFPHVFVAELSRPASLRGVSVDRARLRVFPPRERQARSTFVQGHGPSRQDRLG